MAEEPSVLASHVARMVGIMDRSNFFRLFTIITGMSPDDWRKNHSK
jgi:AraC-like DNA-binding protein